MTTEKTPESPEFVILLQRFSPMEEGQKPGFFFNKTTKEMTREIVGTILSIERYVSHFPNPYKSDRIETLIRYAALLRAQDKILAVVLGANKMGPKRVIDLTFDLRTSGKTFGNTVVRFTVEQKVNHPKMGPLYQPRFEVLS